MAKGESLLTKDLDEKSALNGGELPAGWFWPVLGLAAFLSLPYYFSLETFFSHDDFAILYFHKDWPIEKPWLFFRTDVLTFYRPFQSYVMALLFYYFGMNAFPYGLVLVAIHVANVVLSGRLVERLFDNRALTFFSVIFFAADWEYCDVVFWKGNYGTALCWLFILGATNLFVDYLRGGGRGRYFGSLALAVAALLSKESAVNVPLLLSLLYWVRRPQRTESDTGIHNVGPSAAEQPAATRTHWLFAFARALWPFYALAVAYGIFHLLAVRDVYDWLPKGYELQGPIAATAAIFHAMAFWLAPFLEASSPLFGAQGARPGLLDVLDRISGLLPLVLIAATVWSRNRRLIFGTLWAILAFVPANLIPDYHTPRYYYGSIMGIAVVFAEVALAADRAVAARRRFAEIATARVVGSLLILAFVYSNMIYTTALVSEDARKCRQIEDVYRFLALHRKYIPPKTLFRVQCLNSQDHFHEGMGLREMFKFALNDDSVEAILPDEALTDRVRNILLSEYTQPVEVYRDASGVFRFGIAVPTTATAETELPGPAQEQPGRALPKGEK